PGCATNAALDRHLGTARRGSATRARPAIAGRTYRRENGLAVGIFEPWRMVFNNTPKIYGSLRHLAPSLASRIRAFTNRTGATPYGVRKRQIRRIWVQRRQAYCRSA